MARLCERPGCSEPGAAAYGMFPEDLLFWIAPLHDAPVDDHNVLCQRHADAMVVPRGWTLDDRREPIPRLFMPRRVEPEPNPTTEPTARASRRRPKGERVDAGEQLQIDGTDEIPRPTLADDEAASASESATAGAGGASGGEPANSGWRPDFDHADDLDGLLEVRSPLLARAFRGTGRPKAGPG